MPRQHTVIGRFQDHNLATAALHRLLESGVKPDAVAIDTTDQDADMANTSGHPVRRNITIGAILGALAGVVLEATVLGVPGPGPLGTGNSALAALAGGLSGAALGAAMKGLADARGRRSGSDRAVVRADVDDATQGERARRILQAAGAVETAGGGDDEETRFIRGFVEFTPPLRAHFDATLGKRGQRWSDWERCYRFGWQLANRPDTAGRSWTDVQADVRDEWQRRHPDRPWSDDVASAVERGFTVMTLPAARDRVRGPGR
jgi:hypothetical protein